MRGGARREGEVARAEARGSGRGKRGSSSPGVLSDHRVRQASVAGILRQLFGELADSKPELWSKRAYLMLVGLIYERLATSEDALSTSELVTLSKALAEHRRAEAVGKRARPRRRRHDAGDAVGSNLGDVVRDLYGVRMQAGAGQGPTGEPRG